MKKFVSIFKRDEGEQCVRSKLNLYTTNLKQDFFNFGVVVKVPFVKEKLMPDPFYDLNKLEKWQYYVRFDFRFRKIIKPKLVFRFAKGWCIAPL